MSEYRDDTATNDVYRKRGSGGKVIVGLLLAVVVIVGLLFATGFWSANVKEGALPSVKVSAQGGALPDVDMKSKELVVGTKSTTVDVPKVETQKKTISVPVVGVKGADEK
ncbi:MAG: hypothetical protein JWO15_2354 [Sphingomonadales bacterium]|nr:hypothetical protein [Sphingomonadales bacterium]